MEFIPLEKYSTKSPKTKKRTRAEPEPTITPISKKLKDTDEEKPFGLRKGKSKPQPKVIEKKNVKNKFREIVALKKKKKINNRRNLIEDEKEDDVDNEREEEHDDDDDDNVTDDHDEDTNQEEETEENSEEEAYKKKCKELDEKKKNRLFLKLKKKIYSEGEIKQLHPDIKQVIFPRKKKSRWCWAVFVSEERADEAMKQLMKNKDILVNKPNPHDKVIQKQKEKLKTILKKKEARKKFQKMWM